MSINRRRFHKLATYLEGIRDKSFNYQAWATKWKTSGDNVCGTTCCAAGHMTNLWPSDWHFIMVGGSPYVVRAGTDTTKPHLWSTTLQQLVDWFGAPHGVVSALFCSCDMTRPNGEPPDRPTLIRMLRWAADQEVLTADAVGLQFRALGYAELDDDQEGETA